MIKRRKGSRLITVNGTQYSWFRDKSNTEVRNLTTGKSMVVPNERLETPVRYISVCDCCFEPDYDSLGDPIFYTIDATLPRRVSSFIKGNQL